MAAPRSILFIRLSAIGDVIMASALIPVFRAAFPDARLAWLADASTAELLQDNPKLDRVLIWPRRRWSGLFRAGQYRQLRQEFGQLLQELREPRFDWVIDLQGLIKSGLWAWLSGSPTRIGLGSREGSQWLMNRVIDRNDPRLLIGIEYRKLAEELGLNLDSFAMDIAVPPALRTAMAQRLKELGAAGPLTVLAPFTTRPQKHWLDEHWAELAKMVIARGDAVVLLGGAGDRQRAGTIAAAAPGSIDLSGSTSLLQAAAVIAGAQRVIGVDTGLTHLGIALRVPTLALFGSTRPYLDTGVDFARVLYANLPCSPCHRRPTCAGDFTCMKQHTAAGVLAAADLLERPTP